MFYLSRAKPGDNPALKRYRNRESIKREFHERESEVKYLENECEKLLAELENYVSEIHKCNKEIEEISAKIWELNYKIENLKTEKSLKGKNVEKEIGELESEKRRLEEKERALKEKREVLKRAYEDGEEKIKENINKRMNVLEELDFMKENVKKAYMQKSADIHYLTSTLSCLYSPFVMYSIERGIKQSEDEWKDYASILELIESLSHSMLWKINYDRQRFEILEGSYFESIIIIEEGSFRYRYALQGSLEGDHGSYYPSDNYGGFASGYTSFSYSTGNSYSDVVKMAGREWVRDPHLGWVERKSIPVIETEPLHTLDRRGRGAEIIHFSPPPLYVETTGIHPSGIGEIYVRDEFGVEHGHYYITPTCGGLRAEPADEATFYRDSTRGIKIIETTPSLFGNSFSLF